jgi:uncharacterized protein (UPF0333 family)
MSQEFYVGGGPYNPSITNKGNKKKLVALLVGFVVLVALTLMSFLFIQSSTQDVGKELISAMSENDSKKSYGYLSNAMKSTISEKDWAKYVEDISKLTAKGTISLVQKDESIKEKPLFIYNIKTEKNGIIRSGVGVIKATNKVETITYNRTTL